MIVLDNNEKDIVIPDYNDLDNKPSINGVVLEGNKTADELGIDIDTTNFYTKGQADGRFQLKGNYLTSIPAEYITETELNRKDFATNSDINDEIGKLDSALSGEISKKQNALVSGENIKTINGISLLGNGNIVITGSGEGGSVDLSDYYTKGEVDNLIDNVEVDLTGYATETWVGNHYQPKGSYLTSVPSEYVTETELTAKNYATKSEIPTIPTNISAFTNDVGYATENYIIEYFQPKGNYLTSVPSEYVTETELTNKGYATTTQLNSKQDKLISGTNIKTINGNSILGGGNIELVTDLTGYATETWVLNKGYLTSIPSEYVTETELTSKNYATKSEIPTIPTNVSSFNNDSGYITNSALNGYATETYVSNNYQVKGNYITSIPSEYVTESELQTAIEDSNNIVYLTQAEYDSLGVNLDPSTLYLISDAANVVNFKTINGESILGEGNITIESETVDLTNYYTKTECDGKFQLKGNYLTSIPSEYVTETELTNKGYATTTYVDTQIGNINTILENIIG